MGNYFSVPELTMLDKLQKMCKMKGGDPAGKWDPKWGLQDQYKEMREMVAQQREGFMSNGGVAATITLMLSMPDDVGVQEFCVKLLSICKLECQQILLAWGPLVAALRKFPQNVTIQEYGTFLILRASLLPAMTENCLQELPLLKAAAQTLAQASSSNEVIAGDDVTPPGSSLCGEVLVALQTSTDVSESIVELWYKILALTAHFVSPKEVPVILSQLRKVLRNLKSPHCILLSTLFAMDRMYKASQLHVYDEDIALVRNVFQDKIDDLEVVQQILAVYRSMSLSPSALKEPNLVFSDILVALKRHGEDVGEDCISILESFSKNCISTLYQCRKECIAILCECLQLESCSPEPVKAAAEMLSHIIRVKELRDILSGEGSTKIVSALQRSDIRIFDQIIPSIMQWGVEGTNACFSENDKIRLVKVLTRYCKDESKKQHMESPTIPSKHVDTSLLLLRTWLEFGFNSSHSSLLNLCEYLIMSHTHYDRTAMRLLLLLTLDQEDEQSRLQPLLHDVTRREKSYWFPDNQLLMLMSARIAVQNED
eukprot:TRINITY_DN5262_c1_g1_i1.p1 TRINITY_DN5262_c1_g1~~TRINITY_DN5262_c1_g1_i1.p1  ORF type:complete len:541 (+),score=73.77 TRINITY_DN5262_c1_g1_i1:91-1713(+)